MENKKYNCGYKLYVDGHPKLGLEERFMDVSDELYFDMKHLPTPNDDVTHNINELIEYEFVMRIISKYIEKDNIRDITKELIKEYEEQNGKKEKETV